MGFRRIIPGLILAGLLVFRTASAQVPVQLSISQPALQDGTLTAFVTVTDSSGNAMRGLTSDAMRATYGDAEVIPTALSWADDSANGIGIILLMDVSKSLSEESVARMRLVAESWIKEMRSADRLAVLRFGSTSSVDVGFSADTAVLLGTIRRLRASDSMTYLHRSVLDAVAILKRDDPSLPRRRAVVLLTDGLDDAVGAESSGELDLALRNEHIPVVSIGFPGVSGGKKTKEGLTNLGLISRASGARVLDAESMTPDSLTNVVDALLRETYFFEGRCDDCVSDGNPRRLEIYCTAGGVTVRAGVEMRAYRTRFSDSTSVASKEGIFAFSPLLIGILAVVLLALLGLLVFVLRERRGTADAAGETVDLVASGIANPADTTARVRVLDEQPTPAEILLRIEPVRAADNVRGREFVFDRSVFIGRDAACEFPLVHDQHVSSRHAEIRRDGDALVVLDLQSTNGTSVNGVPLVTTMKLNTGDLLHVGQTELRLTITHQS